MDRVPRALDVRVGSATDGLTPVSTAVRNIASYWLMSCESCGEAES